VLKVKETTLFFLLDEVNSVKVGKLKKTGEERVGRKALGSTLVSTT
jgi:hypothetical protein